MESSEKPPTLSRIIVWLLILQLGCIPASFFMEAYFVGGFWAVLLIWGGLITFALWLCLIALLNSDFVF